MNTYKAFLITLSIHSSTQVPYEHYDPFYGHLILNQFPFHFGYLMLFLPLSQSRIEWLPKNWTHVDFWRTRCQIKSKS